MFAALNKDYSLMLGATRRSSVYRLQRCAELHEPWRACLCRYHSCVGWYPCGLKYCKGKDSSGKVVSYRCGIKTCSKCREFEYYVRHKQQCIWDEQSWGLKYKAQSQSLSPDQGVDQGPDQDPGGEDGLAGHNDLDSQPARDGLAQEEKPQPEVLQVDGEQAEGMDEDILR